MSISLPYPQWLVQEFALSLVRQKKITFFEARDLLVLFQEIHGKGGYCFDDCGCGNLEYHKYLAEFSKEE